MVPFRRRRAATLVVLFTLAASFVPCTAQSVVCPRIGETFLADDRLDTIDPVKRVSDFSGLAFSPTQTSPISGAPIIYGMGDKGDGARIFLWDSSNGQRLLTLHFDTRYVFNQDWEALTIGSCGTLNTDQETLSCLYVGDFGSNTAGDSGGRRDGRDGVPTRIIKVYEPKLEDFEDQDVIPTSYYSVLEFDYLHESSPTVWANCETMFIDHAGWGGEIGDIYLVTKWGGNAANPNADMFQKTRVFKIPADVWPTSNCATVETYSPEAVGQYEVNLTLADPLVTDGDYVVTGGQLFGKEWRGGEMSFDGTLIGLGTRFDAHLFLRCPGQSVADTLAAPDASTTYCLKWVHPTGNAVESFAFAPDGTSSLEIPEGHRARLGWTTFLFDETNTTQSCPDGNSSPASVFYTLPSKEILEICPTPAPSISMAPSVSVLPSVSLAPSPSEGVPTELPTMPTTLQPTTTASEQPTQAPSLRRATAEPTTDAPSQEPTLFPSTSAPSTSAPSMAPTTLPSTMTPTTMAPTTNVPSSSPSNAITTTILPTEEETAPPSAGYHTTTNCSKCTSVGFVCVTVIGLLMA